MLLFSCSLHLTIRQFVHFLWNCHVFFFVLLPCNLFKGLKRAVKGALWSGRLNGRWWISQTLDLFVFCGSSLSPPTNPPTFPLPPYFSHPDCSISIPLHAPALVSHTLPRLSPKLLPHLVVDPGTWESDVDRRGHRTPGKTMEKREGAKQCGQPGTSICHSCTWSTLQGEGREWNIWGPVDDEEGGCGRKRR